MCKRIVPTAAGKGLTWNSAMLSLHYGKESGWLCTWTMAVAVLELVAFDEAGEFDDDEAMQGTMRWIQ
jgi:hypothetical protein